MSEEFDYNQVFMGVKDKRDNYFLSFKDDYRLKRLTEAVKLRGGKMLDIGCGGGLLTESLVYYYPTTKIYGYDVSRVAINYARKFGSGKVTYNVMRGKKIPYKNNFFDVCICLDVMEHIPDVDFFLKEVRRVLKKKGRFYLIVPCEGQPLTFSWFFQKIKMGNQLTYKNWGHIHPEFTHGYVIELLKKNGFNIKQKKYSEHILYQITNLLTYFLPKIIMDKALGEKAAKYYDRGIVEMEVKGQRKRDIFDILRESWLFIGTFLNRFAIAVELETFKKIPLTGWKLNLLAQKNDK